MPKADFNQEFPTRASLRRARQAELEVQEKAGHETEKTAAAPRVRDEFDSIPEAGTGSTAADKQGAVAPATGSPVKTASAADTTSTNATGAKTAPAAASAAGGTVKQQPKPAAMPGAAKPAPAAATPGPSNSTEAKNPAKPEAQSPAAAGNPGSKAEAKPAPPAPAKVSGAKPVPAKPAAPSTAASAPAKPAAPAAAGAKPAASVQKPAASGTHAKTPAPAPRPAEAKPAVVKPSAAPAIPSAVPAAKGIPAPAAKTVAAPAPKPAAAPAKAGAPENKPAPAAAAKPPTASAKPASPAAASKPAESAPASKPAVAPAKPAAPKNAEKPAAAKTAPTPAAVKPAAPKPAAAAAPVPAGTAGESAPAEDLSTAEGRRQAFREMIPAAGTRDTFLRPEDETTFRAERGFRGFLSRLGFNMEPSVQEVQERNWRKVVGTRLVSPKTISVVNGKGGANKTPTAVLLSAVFGRNTGDPVLVWDNNGTRGTLGWRTVQGPHAAHSMDLLAAAPNLVDTKVGDPVIHDYTHYQPEDCYSVLRTDPTLLASEQFVNAADFDQLHGIVSRFFALTIVDSGNDESAERWMRMIDHTDQLVIASTTVEEHAEAGALLLEALAKRGGHYADLAKNAVVIVSQHQPHGNSEQLDRIAHGFSRLARSVVTVPYDAALVKGQIRFEGLRPATRRAWLHATAAVAGALHG